MFAETAGTSLGLDVLSTITSALATVFTPLSATHALSAASTIFSGSKTGITAEYLNSLSISHVSQAIGSTYTSDMSKYISSLSSVDPTTISAYAERSKILSYHNECSLAAAEGSITSALQPSNTQTTQIPVSYTVNKSDTTTSIAAAIAKQIDGNTGFTGAGVTATNSTNIVILKMTTPLSITVTVTPSGHTTAVFKPGPPATITISGTPQANDVITVALPSTAQSSGSSTTAPAAVTGVAPAQK